MVGGAVWARAREVVKMVGRGREKEREGRVMVWSDALVLGGLGVSSMRVVGCFVVLAVMVRAEHSATSSLRVNW